MSKSFSREKSKYIQKLKSALSLEDIKNIRRLLKKLKVMSRGKQRHSMRVSSSLMDMGSMDRDVVLGALFHDYIERGGDIDKLDVSQNVKDIVNFLSVFDDSYETSKNPPLEHLRDVFGKIDNQSLKNYLIEIKVADRVDNLKRRGKNISKGYLKKSIELIEFLMGNYTGSMDLVGLLRVLNKKLRKKIKKRMSMVEISRENGVSEGYDDVSLDYIKNERPKLDLYKDYDSKKVVGDYVYLYRVEDSPILDDEYGQIYVFDKSDGTEVGNAFFGYDKGKLKSSIDVRPDKRRLGIATEIYKWIEALKGDKLVPDLPHSDLASKFWAQKDRPFG